MRPAHHHAAEEPPRLGQRRRMVQDRPPARLRVGPVDRQPRAAEVGEPSRADRRPAPPPRSGTSPAGSPAARSRPRRPAPPGRRARARRAGRRSAPAPARDRSSPPSARRRATAPPAPPLPRARSPSRTAAQKPVGRRRGPRGQSYIGSAASPAVTSAAAARTPDALPPGCGSGGVQIGCATGSLRAKQIAPEHLAVGAVGYSRRSAAATSPAAGRTPPAAGTRAAAAWRGAPRGSCC